MTALVRKEHFRSRMLTYRSPFRSLNRSLHISPRRGFTVIELLVVLSVIAILCALVLPAVQHAREAARQVQCKNNLHQIGLAIHSYSAAKSCFPSGWIMETPVDFESRNGWGWLTMLLPQMDQGTLFNSINFNLHVGDSSNVTARLTLVEAFICPTDDVPARVPFYFAQGGSASLTSAATPANPAVMFEVAGASYAGVFGPEDPLDYEADALGSGSFFANSRIRSSDMLDGLSHTLIVGERPARQLPVTWTGIHQSEWDGPERVVGNTNHSPGDPEAADAEFSSRHPGGVNFLFGDGSVRFLNGHIDRNVYQALGTRAGLELIEHTDF